jgi:isopentenyl diphosphate isomerase/L-lactate dehydrogenase-like FMN-dependent dehydrogenase
VSIFPEVANDKSLKKCCRYVNKDRAITKRIVQHAENRGIKALFITVDAPQLGRREKVIHPKFLKLPLPQLTFGVYRI